MKNLTDKILNEIYHLSARGGFVTMDTLITLYGKSGSALRPVLEDLKEDGLVVEHPEGFQISDHGRNTAQSRWG